MLHILPITVAEFDKKNINTNNALQVKNCSLNLRPELLLWMVETGVADKIKGFISCIFKK